MSSTSENKLHGTIMVECRGKSRAMIMKNVTNMPNVVRVSKTEDDSNGGDFSYCSWIKRRYQKS